MSHSETDPSLSNSSSVHGFKNCYSERDSSDSFEISKTASDSERMGGRASPMSGGPHANGILRLERSKGVMLTSLANPPEATGFVDPWGLPGYGEPYPDCGRWVYRGCLDVDAHNQQSLEENIVGKIYVELTKMSCGRLECPTCYEKAAGKEAHKIEYRLSAVGYNFGLAIHLIVSPSKRDVQELSYKKLRSKAYQIAKRSGFRGGCCIFHPYRLHPRRGWYFSPHFHMLGYGWIVWSRALFEATGWVVKNRGIRHSIEATAFYQISHCGVDKNKNASFDGRMVRQTHSITWFGNMSYNRLRIVPEPEREHICPICGKKLELLTYRGRVALPEKEGSYFFDSDGWELKGSWRFEGG